MRENTVVLFNRVRLFSTISVIVAVLISLIFSDLLGVGSMGWQVFIAVVALAIGIPHGALDHLVTLPKAQPKKMAFFIAVYVAVAVVAVIAILNFNTVGFIVVLFMSAVHFGIGDAAFINEIDSRTTASRKLIPPQAELAEMMRAAGFERCQYTNMAGGIVAVHSGMRL